jgi:anti-sigma factor RsiW
MEHEKIITLMMEALDGELKETGQTEMKAHLQTCPSCEREWQTLQAIHQLFLDTPALSPAADFAQRTLSMLPNSTYRIWLGSVVYGLLLISGFLPLLLIVWLTAQLGPALNQPAFVDGLAQAGGQVLRVGQLVLAAFMQGLGNLGDFLGQNPAIVGLFLVMLGFIALWGGVYTILTNPRRA